MQAAVKHLNAANPTTLSDQLTQCLTEDNSNCTMVDGASPSVPCSFANSYINDCLDVLDTAALARQAGIVE
jgi:hypothetical protein